MASSVLAQDPTGQGGEGGGQSGQAGQKPKPETTGQPEQTTTSENKAALIKKLQHQKGEESPDGVEMAGDGSAGTPPGVSASTHVSLSGFTRPSRLGPGESGEAYVRVDVRNNAVVPGSPLRLDYQMTQGVLSLGNQDLPQPKPRPTGKDRPVVAGFDDTFLIKIPISVDAGAKHGKYPFEGTLSLTVFDTSVGASSPEARIPVNISIVVGTPMPKPIGVRPARSEEVKPAGEARRWTPVLTDQSELALSLALDDSEVVCAGDSAVLLARLVIPARLAVPRSSVRVALTAAVAGVEAGSAELPAAKGTDDTLRTEAVVRLPLKIQPAAEEGDRVVHVQAQCTPVDGEGRPAPGGTVDAQLRFKVRRRVAAQVSATTEANDSGVGDLQLDGGEKQPQTLVFVAAGAGGIGILAVVFWLLRRR